MAIEDSELLLMFREPASREKAYTAIIRKYQERLYWHVRRMLVDHDDSNDVLQNVFIRVWNGLDNFREDARLYTWLYRIATNECLSFIEQKKKRASVPLSDVEEKRLKLQESQAKIITQQNKLLASLECSTLSSTVLLSGAKSLTDDD